MFDLHPYAIFLKAIKRYERKVGYAARGRCRMTNHADAESYSSQCLQLVRLAILIDVFFGQTR